MKGEISFDLIMDDDMAFVEGCYRSFGGNWQVFIFMKRDTAEVAWKMSTWHNGTTGVVVQVPTNYRLNKEMAETLLSQAVGITEWSVVKGPDSMVLR